MTTTNNEEYVRNIFNRKYSYFLFILIIRFELGEELYIACAIINESLYDINADKKKVVK